MTQIEELQKRAFQNKIDKGFNIDDVQLNFLRTYEELAEAFEAYRKKGDLGSELADVMIYLCSIAEMTGLNLSEEVEKKIDIIEGRTYRNINGEREKVE